MKATVITVPVNLSFFICTHTHIYGVLVKNIVLADYFSTCLLFRKLSGNV